MEDHEIINSEDEDSQMEDLQMPVAAEESSKYFYSIYFEVHFNIVQFVFIWYFV